MSERLGFIGLGIMGGAMARNLIGAGYRLTVYNRTRARTDPLAALGASVADSPAEVAAGSDVILSCVTGPDDVRAVALGPGGIIEGARSGSLYIDTSTIAPRVAREVAAALGERGVAVLDAPVTGGDVGAREGTLTIMVGGPEAAFERALPILGAIGKRVVRVGGHGQGQLLKLINNLIGGVALAAAAEGLVLARRGGIDLDVAMDVLSSGSAQSASLALLAKRLAARNFAPGFSLANRHKDFVLALEAGRELGVPLPVGAIAAEMMGILLARGEGDRDQTAFVTLLEEWAGLELG